MSPRTMAVPAALTLALVWIATAPAADDRPAASAQTVPVEQRLAAMERQLDALTTEIRTMRAEADKTKSEIWTVTLKNLDAGVLAKGIGPLVAEMGGRISADPRLNLVVIEAAKAKLLAIKRLILKLEIKASGTATDTDIIDVTNGEASNVADALRALFSDKPGNWRITADAQAQVVIVEGPLSVRA